MIKLTHHTTDIINAVSTEHTADAHARYQSRIAATVAALIFSGGLAAAEDASDTRSQPLTTLEEVIVTAERRAANVQEIPIAISAFSAEALDNQGIFDLDSLQFSVPGLHSAGDRSIGLVTLRGVSQENTSSGGESGIAFHLDGVYQSRTFVANTPLYDMERVEVLRGPQGTLYGRNATGGAINYISNKPTDEFSFSGDVLVGDYDRIATRGALNMPLVAGQLAVRASWLTEDRDGYFDNLALNKSEGDVESRSFRIHALYTPTPNLDILLSTMRETVGGNVVAATALTDQGVGSTPVDGDPYTIYQDFSGGDDDTVSVTSAKVTWDLGSLVLTSLSAYSKTEVETSYDFDYTELPLGVYNPYNISSKQFTQEFQLISTAEGPLEWLVGLYYLEEDINDSGRLQGPNYGGEFPWTATNDSTSIAAYGQGSYALNDKLKLTLGLRYSDDNKDTVDIFNYPPAFTGLPFVFTDVLSREVGWEEVTWKVGADYFLDDDKFLYASVSRGYKAGGVWAGQAEPYNPEYVLAYEIGSKNTFLDGAARLNLSAFFYDYEDMQIRRNRGNDGGTSFTGIMDNASQAEIKGVEIDFTLLPVPGLSISGSAAYTDAEFTEFNTVDTFFPALGEQDLSGNKLPRVPELAFTLSAQYLIDLGSAGLLIPRIGYSWRDELYSSVFNRALGLTEDMPRTDIGLRYEDAAGKWFADAFVHYIEDDNSLLAILPNNTGGLVGYVNAPRTYGVRFGVNL